MKVILADDHRLILDGVRRTLEEAEDIEILGEAASGSELLSLVGRTDPDVVLLDLRMPGLDGASCLEQIRERYPRVKVVVLSACDDPHQIASVLRRGASGYVVKSVNPIDLASVIRQSIERSLFTVVDDSGADHSAARAAGLSEREISILRVVARGLSNQAIGKELWVSEQTVKFHLRNIYRKLGLANRTEAVRYAHEHGLVETPLAEVV